VIKLMATALLVAAVSVTAAHAAAEPHTDCGGDGPATMDTPPTVGIWFGDKMVDWAPPACSGWLAQPFTVLVETFGTTALTGGPDDILMRLARISDLTTIQYWSTTRQRWRTLISDAAALDGPDPEGRRADFSVAELRAGPLFFWQDENTPLGRVTYQMHVRQADRDTVVVEIANALPARAGLFERVPPGRHTFFYRFHRSETGVWSLYGLMRSGSGPRLIASAGRKSYGNRAVALFRYLAGLPTDGTPPRFP
jgi:hypothetical protein